MSVWLLIGFFLVIGFLIVLQLVPEIEKQEREKEEEEYRQEQLKILREIRDKKMKNRNLDYENKFRAYLFKGDFERHKQICLNLNVIPSTPKSRGEE